MMDEQMKAMAEALGEAEWERQRKMNDGAQELGNAMDEGIDTVALILKYVFAEIDRMNAVADEEGVTGVTSLHILSAAMQMIMQAIAHIHCLPPHEEQEGREGEPPDPEGAKETMQMYIILLMRLIENAEYSPINVTTQ